MWKGRALVVAGVTVAVLLGAAVVTGVVISRGSGELLDGEPDSNELGEAMPVTTGYALDRADPVVGGEDVIVEFAFGTALMTPVYAAARIIDFVIAGDDLVVVTELAGSHTVASVDRESGVTRTVGLPEPGTVGSLAVDGSRVGFLFTSAGDPADRTFSTALMSFEVGQGAALPVERGGEVFETTAWAWIPGTGQVLAISSSEELLRFDPASADSPEQIGEWENIEAVSSDGLRAIVRDHHDTVDISLSDGEGAPFAPSPIDGQAPFGGDVEFLGAGPERVQKVALADAAAGRMVSVIVLDDGVVPRILYRASASEGIDEFSVSPDGAVVAVEVVPDVSSMVSDGYYPYARSVSVVTRLVSVATGEVIAEFPGFGVRWPASVA